MTVHAERIGALWLDELGRLAGHVLHDLRNGLQGVAVNLEVLRSRVSSGASTSTVDQLRPFAVNAANEFELLSNRIEAFVSLARDGHDGPDVGSTLEALASVLRGMGRNPLEVEHGSGPAQIGLSHAATRLLLAGAIMPAIRGGARVRCTLTQYAPVTVQISYDGPRGQMDPELEALAEELNVKMEIKDNVLSVSFPTRLRSDTVLV